MSERPILFSGAMVRAILEGRKTQTRRVVKPQPQWSACARKKIDARDLKALEAIAGAAYQKIARCPYGVPGDRLWVRETWSESRAVSSRSSHRKVSYAYRSDEGVKHGELRNVKWRPSIFMPRAACRLVLEVTAVRVERLQDISEADAEAEGGRQIEGMPGWWSHSVARLDDGTNFGATARDSFRILWDSLNAKRAPWASNPWVWVVEFRQCAATSTTARREESK